ncbi:MAG: sigma-70 family RNA polymerase sigma factor [Myxococcales bacterium]|nr:sigma-70 family RNA polymerase sigma factor [Myxococcales bacterium]
MRPLRALQAPPEPLPQLGDIFQRYRPAVQRFLGDLFRSSAAAEEATQETFARAHQAIGRLRDGEKVAGWLFGIARHVYLEARREKPTEELREDEPALEAVLPTPTPERLLLDRELEDALERALSGIAPERRSALLLRIDHGLGYEEIAEVMGWNLAKVKNEIHRARLQLRVELAQHVGGHR